MPLEKSQLSTGAKAAYRVGYFFTRLALGALMLLPYRARIPATGWLVAHIFGPLAGFKKRVRHNLAITMPDMDKLEVERLCTEVCDNAGRTMMEQLSTKPFCAQAAKAPITGPGWDAFLDAAEQGRPIIACGAHFGNYLALRAATMQLGHPLGVIYRRMANPYFHDFYIERLENSGGPIFEQGAKGMRSVVKHMRGGGKIGILTDLHVQGGEELMFFGQPAVTSTATAEMALKFNALLVPAYAVRQPDGISFELQFREPIPHSDPITMTQAMNDDLEEMTRKHMGQWFWIHRRWKIWQGNGLRRGHPDG